MAKKPQRHKQESDWFLEALRIEFTELNQDDFIAQCGFARATYQRWAARKLALGEVKLTVEQIAAVCRVCGISLKGFFQHSGVDITDIPSVLHDNRHFKKSAAMKAISCMIEESQKQEKSLLRLRRENFGYTRPQVKQCIGVSERMQADWESGKSMPAPEKLAALARLYKVSLKTIYVSLGIDVTGIPDDVGEP